MPIQIEHTQDGFGIEFKCSGIVTGEDIIAANKEIYNDDNFLKQRYQIVDRSNCETYQVSNEEIRIIAQQDTAAAKKNPNVIIAIVSATDLQFGISRMYQALVGDKGFLTEVFRERKSAEEWIEKHLTDVG